MDARGDAFIALPGGLGTLEEILEALVLRRLGYHAKPVTVLDLDGSEPHHYGLKWDLDRR